MFQSASRQSGKVSTRTIVGWAAFFLFLAVIAMFGYKVQYYYRHLKAGNIVELPSPQGRFTVARDNGARSAEQLTEVPVDEADAPHLGAPAEQAEFVVVMFGDFACPYCAQSATTFRRMAVKYADRVRFIYRDYPLPEIHPESYQASLAAECANEQRRFWEYFDRLYGQGADLSEAGLSRHAQEAGLDQIQFDKCYADERYERRIIDDMAAAEMLGLRGTPTFYIDGRKVEGSLEEKDFARIIDKLLEQ